MNALDTRMAELAHDLDIDMGTLAAARRVDQMEEPRPFSTDPIERQVAKHREAIAIREKRIIEIERARDIAIRGYEADLATAERAYNRLRSQLVASIESERDTAARRLDILRQLIRSSEAAIIPLEPNAAEREAPMAERMVPRPARVEVPIMRHGGIKS